MSIEKEPSTFGFSPAGLERVAFTFLVSDALKKITAAVDNEMKSIGLTRLQWSVLVQVFRMDKPSQSDLAKIVGVGRAALGVAIDDLEKSGYVERKPDPVDRRIWQIHPTSMALEKSVAIAGATEKATDKVYAQIMSKELVGASQVFLKIIKNLT